MKKTIETLEDFCQKNRDKKFKDVATGIVFVPWPAGTLSEKNESYAIGEFLPGHAGFATDGGGELVVIEMETGHIYSVPFIPMEFEYRKKVAESLAAFAALEIRERGPAR